MPITLFIIVLICVITILTLPTPSPPNPPPPPPFRLKWTSRAVTSTTSCCHRQQPTTSSSACWRPGWSVTPSMYTGKAWTPCVLPSWLSTLTMKVCVGRGWGVERGWGWGWCEGLGGQSLPVCVLWWSLGGHSQYVYFGGQSLPVCVLWWSVTPSMCTLVVSHSQYVYFGGQSLPVCVLWWSVTPSMCTLVVSHSQYVYSVCVCVGGFRREDKSVGWGVGGGGGWMGHNLKVWVVSHP